MKILVTGAGGFVGKNLCEALKNIRDGKDRRFPELSIEEIFRYTRESTAEELARYCVEADFVFHLAGVNRPERTEEFREGNVTLTETLLDALKTAGNRCPVMISSSVQASLSGRFGDSAYGRSKREGEELCFAYAKETGARVLVYRFPNLFGKWCRPNYNSAVATFCHNIARDLPIRVNDPSVELELLYIDDLVAEMLLALQGKEHRARFEDVTAVFDEDGPYCACPVTHRATLGEIVALLRRFREQPETLLLPEIPAGSFAKKLYSAYLSYLPPERAVFPLTMHSDARGSFTELLKSAACGQFSVNISRPGITKGQHWHNSKWELFIVVSGHALIRQRRIGSEEILEFEVSGEKIEAVHMLPGYTHSIVNLSDTEDLVTLMWANECFDPANPDTFREDV
ncbi:MAG: capsular polysaccharide biosynthesis protein CapF [Oscillospiraceae bacterium]|nr:capsular polysaccharide biosynthesis protein CapF [Oscillospiraceae bacterium]